MRILYLDCSMGAAGDMLAAALLELLPEPADFVGRLNALGIPDVTFACEPAVKCGITGTHLTVRVSGEAEGEEPGRKKKKGRGRHHDGHHHDEHHRHHAHTGLKEIEGIVSGLAVPEQVRTDILAVYRLIAGAEGTVHGCPADQIHFHEVGTMDAVADVTAVCLLMYELHPDRVLASPVHVGYGQVECAHGTLPVPAPATTLLLQGVPIYGGSIQGELCTPTGAALLRHFVSAFGEMPVLRLQAAGYGMGTKDFPAANCVRALLGEDGCAPEADAGPEDQVLELSCNLDDMTAEEIGSAMDCLLAAGALDVFTVPIGMKKSRPGTMLTVLCREEDRAEMLSLLFRHTATLGVREAVRTRHVLDRREETLQTPFGAVRRKVSSGYGCERIKYEYEDLVRIARAQGISLREAEELIRASEKSLQTDA